MDRNAVRRAIASLAFAAVTSLVLAGCGDEDPPPAAQPTPAVTTFEPAVFDDIPQYPRTEPVGPRTEEHGVVSRSYKAPGTSPEQILDFYKDALEERWRMVAPVEKLGVGTLRADWVNNDDDYRLRVSATREPLLDSQKDASETFVTQYSVTLHPR